MSSPFDLEEKLKKSVQVGSYSWSGLSSQFFDYFQKLIPLVLPHVCGAAEGNRIFMRRFAKSSRCQLVDTWVKYLLQAVPEKKLKAIK